MNRTPVRKIANYPGSCRSPSAQFPGKKRMSGEVQVELKRDAGHRPGFVPVMFGEDVHDLALIPAQLMLASSDRGWC